MFKLVVLSSVLALVAASPSAIAPWGVAGVGWAGHLGAALHAPLVAPLGLVAPYHGAHNYRGPLSLAPGQTASILAADGRPLDTLDVNLDRAAHYTAKAVDHAGVHLLRKRSAPLLAAPWAAPVAWSHAPRVVAPAHLAVPATAHVAWRAPVAHWGLGPLSHAAPLAHW